MVCFSEQNGRLITTITMKLIEQDTFIDFEENILLQMLHQKLKFNPKDFFEFDFKFIVDVMSFAVTYALIFIEFYYY